ncbi:glycosyltransferase family 2 protein [Cycloclasticus zancles]|uniref:Glycosyltransferase involved in cell wall biogenesis n=1 Tax=Cycloclasticus zancles 78-ME TaxID=1198232 RepID=S5TI55_9GAMM|nr:glycosyltransferase family A protein [Cycloclasticus zancles]AGS40567.1 Glycosyltransferase involved in cell wall biogenesis [Cycloclasticus zancles 78-ME]
MAIDSKCNHSKKVLDIVIPVYNDNPYLLGTLTSIFKQQLPNDWCFHVYIVDDGSEVPVSLDIPKENTSTVSLVRLEKNSGCSVARNQGAIAGNGEVILFLDADCSLAKASALALLLKEYEKGYDVCFGQIYAPQGDFWAKYQNEVARDRADRFYEGEHSSMTTQVFMVRRNKFKSVGGFDESYHFGFEDRDLFLSLIKIGAKISLAEKVVVNHNDQLSLSSVVKKLYGAGKNSSTRFIEKYPDEYSKLAYIKADVRYSPYLLKSLVILIKPMLPALVGMLERCITRTILPYSISKVLVKYVSGLYYLQGTYETKKGFNKG